LVPEEKLRTAPGALRFAEVSADAHVWHFLGGGRHRNKQRECREGPSSLFTESGSGLKVVGKKASGRRLVEIGLKAKGK
jgi:hypothetical protein